MSYSNEMELCGEIYSVLYGGKYDRTNHNLLEQRDMLEQWYKYEGEAREQTLREWCENNSIEIDD